MKTTTAWRVTLKKGKESIIVESIFHNVNDLLIHFEENVGIRPSSIEKI